MVWFLAALYPTCALLVSYIYPVYLASVYNREAILDIAVNGLLPACNAFPFSIVVC
ncbi:hypothetical protein F4861DRAFT_520723 [Xylaria intraflava]|nr:hypothetical protein F4861DRAFT_520723 [Xylaria intraflava]